jgi:phosphoglycolate phosphatase-like HAD superfamily hydrolase
MIKAVVFDFDGTLADSFSLFIDSFRKIAPPNVNKNVSLDVKYPIF